MITILILFTLLQLADGWTTYRVFQLGGHERNPVAAAVMTKIGLVPTILLFKGGATALAWYLLDQPYGPEVVGGLCVFYFLIVWNNWNVMERLQDKP